MNIVICCDGTRGKYGQQKNNTNVVRLFERLGSDGPDQNSYYDPGVGTYSPLRGAGMAILDKLAASISGVGITSEGIDKNTEEAYRYLMDGYTPGAKIFLFGYSRGAHTVRELAGMIHKCGLLTKGSYNLIPSMMDIYRQKDNEEIAAGFKREFCRRGCSVYFIGVWDTVASIGWAVRRQFSCNRLSFDVTHGYQALSIDERRRQFRPSIWDETDIPGQTIKQVWFPGSHSDVGGQNDADRGISDLPLVWMLENAHRECLILREDWKEDLHPNHTGTIRKSDRHFWRVGAKDRPISKNTDIHQSVIDRRDDPNQDYQPGNLPL